MILSQRISPFIFSSLPVNPFYFLLFFFFISFPPYQSFQIIHLPVLHPLVIWFNSLWCFLFIFFYYMSSLIHALFPQRFTPLRSRVDVKWNVDSSSLISPSRVGSYWLDAVFFVVFSFFLFCFITYSSRA